MVVPYDIHGNSTTNQYKLYYEKQAGGDLPVFYGATVQRGNGLGGLFSKVLRGVAPVLKDTARSLGRNFINSSIGVAKDMIDGKKFTESAKQNFSKGGKNFLSSLEHTLSTPLRGGVKRKHSTSRQTSKRKLKSNKNKRRKLTKDIFE